MCNGFGMIIMSDLKGYFTAPDSGGDISHSDILEALKWPDSRDQFTRRFVRIECDHWTIDSFRFDEDRTLPGWAEENQEAIYDLVEKRLQRVAPIVLKYTDAYDAAWKKYRVAREAAWEPYNVIRVQFGLDTPEEVAAHAVYAKLRDQAIFERENTCDAAYTEMVEQLKPIEGYVEP